MKIKVILLFFLILLYCNYVLAAKVYGNIYDFSLNKVSEAKVELNTTPHQFVVSKDGSYSFDIQNGFYTIKAEFEEKGFILSESRNISIKDDGDYIIDLVLFPNLEEELEEPEIDILDEKKSSVSLLVFVFLLILGIIIFIIFRNKKNYASKEDSKELEQDYEKNLDDIIKIIEDEDGRATQKDIRKKMPYSEAKISLMIAELEHKNIVEKIKKGRGNIIILKKK